MERFISSMSYDKTSKNPREVSDFRIWDGVDHPITEWQKKWPLRIFIVGSVAAAAVVVFTPVRAQQVENSNKLKNESQYTNQTKFSAKEQLLIDEVLKVNGLFIPDGLDNLP